MIINSNEIAGITEMLLKKLEIIKEKSEFYCKEELKEKNGSNFSFLMDENILIHLQKIHRVLNEKNNLSIDTAIGDEVKKYYTEMPGKFDEYDKLLDHIFQLPNKSIDQDFFYMPFFNWASNFANVIKNVYLLFLEKIELKEIIEDSKSYKELFKLTQSKKDELSETIKNIEERGNNAILKLEQASAEKKVIDIKKIYDLLIKKTNCSKNIYGILFFGSCLIVIIILIMLFLNLTIFQDEYIIPRSVIFAAFFSFIAFLVNDFRKRFNIEKQILDELAQKQNLVDAYAALLVIIEKFDIDIKKIYHNKMLDNIIDNLLAIKNHGFLSKKIMQDNPNIAMDALNLIIEKTKKGKDEKQD